VNCVRTITLTHFREGVGESNYLPILRMLIIRSVEFTLAVSFGTTPIVSLQRLCSTH